MEVVPYRAFDVFHQAEKVLDSQEAASYRGARSRRVNRRNIRHELHQSFLFPQVREFCPRIGPRSCASVNHRPGSRGRLATPAYSDFVMIEEITPVIITYNEAPNIGRTLDKLVWAKRIIIIDSGSDDQTLEIIRSYRQAQVIHRPFDDCASQWNFGNNQVDRGWILSLDADYELSDAFIAELQGLDPSAMTSGYRANFVYRISGRPLRVVRFIRRELSFIEKIRLLSK